MRSSNLAILAALGLACAALAAPTASAATSRLAFEAPASTPANSTLPISVTLTLGQFLCHEPHTLTVQLTTTNTDGVRGVFERSTLAFTVPARSYYAEPYSETQVVNLTIRAIAAGTVEMGASFAADVGPCFVPGGFDPATATATIAVDAPSMPATTPTNETNKTPGGDANATDPNATTTTKPPTPKRSNNSAPSCGPDGGCGPIGEYASPTESSSNETPGVSLLPLLATLGIAALVARRRRSS